MFCLEIADLFVDPTYLDTDTNLFGNNTWIAIKDQLII
jgi:hypothetical protein